MPKVLIKASNRNFIVKITVKFSAYSEKIIKFVDIMCTQLNFDIIKWFDGVRTIYLRPLYPMPLYPMSLYLMQIYPMNNPTKNLQMLNMLT